MSCLSVLFLPLSDDISRAVTVALYPIYAITQVFNDSAVGLVARQRQFAIVQCQSLFIALLERDGAAAQSKHKAKQSDALEPIWPHVQRL